MTYGISAKIMDKQGVAGLFLIDTDGKELMLSYNKAVQLIESGHVTNWEIITDEDGEKHLYSENTSINDLPNKTKETDSDLKIINRLTKDSKLVGYTCVDAFGIKHNYSLDKFWRLAKLEKIQDINIMKTEDSRLVISNKHNLKELPNVEM